MVRYRPVAIRLTINDAAHAFETTGGTTLATLLRDDAALTGTKIACGEGTCGSCTVLLDGRPVLSCLTLAEACDGSDVRTVEWRGEPLERLRAAFAEHDGFQCGFCTPGQLMSALALIERNPRPDRAAVRKAMSGNLCRCGAYAGIERAILAVAAGDAG